MDLDSGHLDLDSGHPDLDSGHLDLDSGQLDLDSGQLDLDSDHLNLVLVIWIEITTASFCMRGLFVDQRPEFIQLPAQSFLDDLQAVPTDSRHSTTRAITHFR